MRIKRLKSLLQGIDIVAQKGPENPSITGLAYDSRKVKDKFLFAAIEGFHTDGHKFINHALRQGAFAVVYSKSIPLPAERTDISFIKVKDSRKALSHIAANFYDKPSEKLKVIGVTGTDGKSTTVWLIYQLLILLNRKTGFISTVNIKTGDKIKKNAMRQSTPESLEIQSMLAEMVENSNEYAVVESTSHGLSERTARLYDVSFDAGVLTNITHEHLEFHGTIEQYRYDKANLFRKASLFNVVNGDDHNYRYFIRASSVPAYTYSIKRENTEIYASNIKLDMYSSVFTVHYEDTEAETILKLPGEFNIYNTLAAVLTVLKILNLKLNDIIPLIPELKGVKGRMEEISAGQPFKVIVDYAHTPESFKLVLPVLKQNTKGKLIAVFGSAGERDTEKRPLQGKIASEYCDIIILTDEDPRAENRESILEDIARGIKENKMYNINNLYLIPNREKAIQKAFAEAEEEDTVVLLGKGHEKSIIYNGYSIAWDEKRKAEEILRTAGLS